jgi:hypothetical protein
METKHNHAPGGKSAVEAVLNMDNVEATNVPLTVNNDTSTTHVTTTSDHADVTGIELDEVGDLVIFEIKTNCVICTNKWVGVTDCTAIVSDNIWHTTCTHCETLDLEELIGSLLGGNSVDGESALNVVQQTEVLARFLDRNDIC